MIRTRQHLTITLSLAASHEGIDACSSLKWMSAPDFPMATMLRVCHRA